MSLWPNNTAIDILGVTGPLNSGKTLFLLSIAEPSRTLIFDLEESSASYSGLGFDRVDIPRSMAMNGLAYTPLDAFRFFLKQIDEIEPGRYDVIAVDPIPGLEEGLVDWVGERYAGWGFSSKAAFEAMKGVRWQRIKSEWEKILLNISAKCTTFAFSCHLKNLWRHGRPTGEQTPQGKTSLMMLASLFIQLERTDTVVPSGIVLKSRLSQPVLEDGRIARIVPLLPERLPVATPNAIREYILNPPDPDAPREEERVQPKTLSETEKLQLQAKIAEDNRIAKEAEILRVKEEARLRKKREAAVELLRDKD